MLGLKSHHNVLLSHPDILLFDHLRDVAERASRLILQLNPHMNLAISCEDLARAAFIAGCTHDFGKAKRQFQEYIRGGKGKDKDHAAISSVFTFLVASDVFKKKPQPTRLLPFVCAYAVNRHHGLLCNPEEAFEEASIEHQIAIARNSIDPQVWDFEFTCRSLDLTVRFSEYRKKFEDIQATEITEYFQKFSNRLRQAAEQDGARESWLVDLYFALLLVVSSLTEADVACVIQAPEPRPASRLDSSMVRGYAFKQPTASKSFQQLRERAWEKIQEGIRDPQAAFRLTLPTGLGKTLMGLYLAGVMQDKNTPRLVVYALPYLSIIEQTVDVARKVFDKTDVSVIQHHSLSFPDTRSDEEPNFEKARFSLEDWDADLVVTTFDQLFYSFLSQDRSFIRRFFRLPGSVFLLDEVQTIPARLIPVVETFLEKLRDKLRTKIIYMTATHPPFLQSIVSIVKDEERYFKSLQRTRLRLDYLRDPVAFKDYLSSLDDWLLERKGRKILLVANTIRSARDLFAHLSKLKSNESKFNELHLFLLSGSVVPIERLQRIKKIRKLVEENPEAWICVVSTQCVEAGVDLDMDEAVRDFAPWDSIMQICGRVNRFGKRSRADVWIYRWVDDSTNREFHSYIYDSVFTNVTLDVLADCQTIGEEDYYNIQKKYVQELEQRLSKDRQILRSALTWEFDKLDFRKLFRDQEKAWKISVFCVVDDTSESLKRIAIELWSNKNAREALDLIIKLCDSSSSDPLFEFLKISRDNAKSIAESMKNKADRELKLSLPRLLRPMLQAYTISIPVRRFDQLPHAKIVDGMYYFDRVTYEALNATGLGEEVALPDWIV
jgi:CRISPR-associated endonuclease/helicase Cas3